MIRSKGTSYLISFLMCFLLGPELKTQLESASGAHAIPSETSNKETAEPEGDRWDDEDWGSLEVNKRYLDC